MSFRKPFELQRLRYWQGQMLRSRDLRDQVANDAHLRWWHNRALHNTFGIVSGFEVSLNDGSAGCPDAATRFEADGQSVIVCPGVAYDCFGRELILTEPYQVVMPSEATGLTLLARFRENEEFPGRDEVGAACLPGSASRLVERPVFDWKRSDQVEITDGVVLARFGDDGSRLDERTGRRAARALARPRIANGATLPGNTAWRVWELAQPNQFPTPLGLEVMIDTKAAGFTDTPCYFAWLQGSLWNEQPIVKSDDLLGRGSASDKTVDLVNSFVSLQLLASNFVHIFEPTQTGFILRLWLPQVSRLAGWQRAGFLESEEPLPGELLLTIAQAQQLCVCWLGIQPI